DGRQHPRAGLHRRALHVVQHAADTAHLLAAARGRSTSGPTAPSSGRPHRDGNTRPSPPGIPPDGQRSEPGYFPPSGKAFHASPMIWVSDERSGAQDSSRLIRVLSATTTLGSGLGGL